MKQSLMVRYGAKYVCPNCGYIAKKKYITCPACEEVLKKESPTTVKFPYIAKKKVPVK